MCLLLHEGKCGIDIALVSRTCALSQFPLRWRGTDIRWFAARSTAGGIVAVGLHRTKILTGRPEAVDPSTYFTDRWGKVIVLREHLHRSYPDLHLRGARAWRAWHADGQHQRGSKELCLDNYFRNLRDAFLYGEAARLGYSGMPDQPNV